MPAGKERPRRGVDMGHHYSFLGGRITVGPDWKAFMASVLLVAAPAGVFMGFVAPWLGRHQSWVIFAFSVVLIVFSLTVLFVTAFTNPGFLPRNHLDEDEEYGRRNPTKEFQVNGFTVTTKWCTTCNHYRPPRCSHCAVCDNCVDKFDHHCPWVGTCIGRRNYRWFLCFVFSTTLLCVWVFTLSLVQLLKYTDQSGRDFGHAIRKYPASLVCMIYSFLAFWFVGGLSALHMYLSGSNQTTYEHFRHRYSDAGNPYNVGVLRNCASIFCTQVPKRSELGQLASKAPEPLPETEMASRPWEPPPHVEYGDGSGYRPPGGAGGQNGSGDPAHLAHAAAHYDEKVPPLPNGGLFSPAAQEATPEAGPLGSPRGAEQVPLVHPADGSPAQQPVASAATLSHLPASPAQQPLQPQPPGSPQHQHSTPPQQGPAAASQHEQPGDQQPGGDAQPPPDAVHPAQGGIGVEQPAPADTQVADAETVRQDVEAHRSPE